MKIKMNMKGFKLVEEGERVLKITKAECTPSGKPDKLKVTFQDVKDGGMINSQYSFNNSGAVFAMSKLAEVALGLEDGDEFDTKTDTARLVGKELLCEVVHTQGTKPNNDGELPTFANVKKVISLADTSTGEIVDSPRNAIANQDDEDDLD
jgi:hypothetical protein